MFWHIYEKNVNFTTCFDTFAKTMSILRHVLTHVWKAWQFYDVFLMVRTLKYGTVARFCRKCKKNVDETLPEPSGTLRAKYSIYWWQKKSIVRRVFAYLRTTEEHEFYSVFWHIGKHHVDFTTCFDTFSKNTINFTTCFWRSEHWSTALLHDFFSQKYEKRRRDAPGTLRAPDRLYWPGLSP